MQTLLHGYVDGELDLAKGLELEGHLRDCATCADAHARLRALGASLRNGAPYFRAPAGLRERIQSAVRAADERKPTARVFPWRLAAVAASLMLAVAAGWLLLRGMPGPSPGELLAREVVADYLRAQVGDEHRMDVVSADTHTVKPWFDGKVNYSFNVKDLAEQGFPLVGGRLDYLDEQRVAALVYRRRNHFIDLFVWPAQRPEAAPRALTRRGFQMVHWTQGDLTYWAVSNLNAAELREFADLIRQ